MAGQERQGTRGRGRSRRDASWPVVAAASAVVSGSSTGVTTSTGAATDAGRLATRATYRSLLLKGLAPDEAANLTAYMCGLQVGDQNWSLREVNRLLFLRELNRTGRFGSSDGAAGPH